MSYYNPFFIFRDRGKDPSEVSFPTFEGRVYKLKPSDLSGFEYAKDGAVINIPLDGYNQIKEKIDKQELHYKKILRRLSFAVVSAVTLASAGLYFLNPVAGVAALSYATVKFGASLPRARDFIGKVISREYREYVRDYVGTLHRLAVQSLHIGLISDAKIKYPDGQSISVEDLQKLSLVDDFTKNAERLFLYPHLESRINQFRSEYSTLSEDPAYAFAEVEPEVSSELPKDIRPVWRKIVEMPARFIRDIPAAVRGYAGLFNMKSFDVAIPAHPSQLTVHMPQIHVG